MWWNVNEIRRIGLRQKFRENSYYYIKKNKSRQQSVMVYVKNKSSTRDRMDFEKKTGHKMNIVFDFMGNTCKYVMIKDTKWNTQKRVRIDLILETICPCNEVIFWIIFHLITNYSIN